MSMIGDDDDALRFLTVHSMLPVVAAGGWVVRHMPGCGDVPVQPPSAPITIIITIYRRQHCQHHQRAPLSCGHAPSPPPPPPTFQPPSPSPTGRQAGREGCRHQTLHIDLMLPRTDLISVAGTLMAAWLTRAAGPSLQHLPDPPPVHLTMTSPMCSIMYRTGRCGSYHTNQRTSL